MKRLLAGGALALLVGSSLLVWGTVVALVL